MNKNQYSSLKDETNDSKIFLDNIPSVNTSQQLQRMLDDNRGVIKLTPAKRKFRFQKQKSLNLSMPKLDISQDSPKGSQKRASPSARRSSLHLSPKDFEPPKELIQEEKNEKYEWSPDKEGVFQSYRDSAKNLLSKKVRSSSWNHLGFSSFIQASQKEEKSKLKSDTKLAKYMSGDLLSAEDYKLIANSSVLLNKYVDKKFFQSVVNKLDPQIIEMVSLIGVMS